MKANQTQQHFASELGKRIRADYLLYLPSAYAREPSRTWPVILFLHGSGERGRQVAKVAAHGPPRLVRDQPDFPFIVVSPQCPAGQYWSNEILLPLLDHVLENHRTDRSRVYLTGLSMGGFGVWNLALGSPERFAAIAPVCGGGDVLPILLGDRHIVRAMATLPVWAFHGACDEVVRVEETERMVTAMRQIGNTVRVTVYPGVGHDSWTETYNNPALYQWFLEHRRVMRHKTPRSAG